MIIILDLNMALVIVIAAIVLQNTIAQGHGYAGYQMQFRELVEESVWSKGIKWHKLDLSQIFFIFFFFFFFFFILKIVADTGIGMLQTKV